MSLNTHRKRQKPQNFPIFKDCVFFQNFYKLVDWNVETGQQGTNVLSSMLRKEINAVFKRKLSGIDIGKDKIPKVFVFSLFLFIFCQIIDKLRGIKRLKA